MILLSLILYVVHYDLLNCEKIVTAKLDDLLEDQYHQNLFQVNTLLEALEQKSRKLSVLIAHNYDNGARRKEELVPENNTHVLKTEISDNLNRKASSNPAVFLAHSDYNNIDSHSESPSHQNSYSPPSNSNELVALNHPVARAKILSPKTTTRPTQPGLHELPSLISAKVPFQYAAGFLYSPKTQKQGFTTQHFARNPPSLVTHSSETTTIRAKTTMLGQEAKSWLNQIAPYTRDRRRPITSKHSHSSVSPSPGISDPTTMSTHPTGIGNKTLHVIQVQHVFRNITAIPVKKPMQTQSYNKTWMTPLYGSELYGNNKVQEPLLLIPKQRYQELMEQLEEGHLMVFGIEMFRLIAVKEKSQVRQLLAPLKMIYNNWSRTGRLDSLDEPFLGIFSKLALMKSDADINALRTYSAMMFHTLLQRKQVLSHEVNTIIDRADLAYNDVEGEYLLSALRQLEDYPNTTASSYSICENLIESILLPLRLPAHLQDNPIPLDTIIRAFQQTYPLSLREREEPYPGRDTPISRIRNRPRKRKKKHHHHKRKRKKKKRQFQPVFYFRNVSLRSVNPYLNDKKTKFRSNRYRMVTWRPAGAAPQSLNARDQRISQQTFRAQRYRTLNKEPTPRYVPPDYEVHNHSVLRQHVQKKQMNEVMQSKPHHDANVLKERKHATNDRVVSRVAEVVTGASHVVPRSTRTPGYRETSAHDRFGTRDQRMSKMLKKQMINEYL